MRIPFERPSWELGLTNINHHKLSTQSLPSLGGHGNVALEILYAREFLSEEAPCERDYYMDLSINRKGAKPHHRCNFSDLQNKAQWLDEICFSEWTMFFFKSQTITHGTFLSMISFFTLVWEISMYVHLIYIYICIYIYILTVSIPKIVIFCPPPTGPTCAISSVHYSNLTSEGEMRVDLESIETLLKESGKNFQGKLF